MCNDRYIDVYSVGWDEMKLDPEIVDFEWRNRWIIFNEVWHYILCIPMHHIHSAPGTYASSGWIARIMASTLLAWKTGYLLSHMTSCFVPHKDVYIHEYLYMCTYGRVTIQYQGRLTLHSGTVGTLLYCNGYGIPAILCAHVGVS